MVETEVLILGAIATLFVIGWAVLGIKDAFRSDKPHVAPEPTRSTEPEREPARQR